MLTQEVKQVQQTFQMEQERLWLKTECGAAESRQQGAGAPEGVQEMGRCISPHNRP